MKINIEPLEQAFEHSKGTERGRGCVRRYAWWHNAPSSALSQLRSGYCSRLQSYRHSDSVGWADDPTCPECHSADHTVAHLFRFPTHPTDLAPEEMWVHPSRYPNSWQGSHSLPIFFYCRSTLTPFPPNPHSRCWPPSHGTPAGPHHLHLTLRPISFHFGP